jgi:hypothetical protein
MAVSWSLWDVCGKKVPRTRIRNERATLPHPELLRGSSFCEPSLLGSCESLLMRSEVCSSISGSRMSIHALCQ